MSISLTTQSPVGEAIRTKHTSSDQREQAALLRVTDSNTLVDAIRSRVGGKVWVVCCILQLFRQQDEKILRRIFQPFENHLFDVNVRYVASALRVLLLVEHQFIIEARLGVFASSLHLAVRPENKVPAAFPMHLQLLASHFNTLCLASRKRNPFRPSTVVYATRFGTEEPHNHDDSWRPRTSKLLKPWHHES